jgi:hypothetical protein
MPLVTLFFQFFFYMVHNRFNTFEINNLKPSSVYPPFPSILYEVLKLEPINNQPNSDQIVPLDELPIFNPRMVCWAMALLLELTAFATLAPEGAAGVVPRDIFCWATWWR